MRQDNIHLQGLITTHILPTNSTPTISCNQLVHFLSSHHLGYSNSGNNSNSSSNSSSSNKPSLIHKMYLLQWHRGHSRTSMQGHTNNLNYLKAQLYRMQSLSLVFCSLFQLFDFEVADPNEVSTELSIRSSSGSPICIVKQHILYN